MTFESKKAILLKNLYTLNQRQNSTNEQKLLTISDISRLYCESFTNDSDILKELISISEMLSTKDEIIFLSELCRSEHRKKIKEQLFIGSTEATLAGAHSKISFVKNKYNNIAFEHFSHSVVNSKAEYASSFSESCESVFDGRCEFCILPIMNSTDGRLMSFYNLLDRYELKICEITDIDSESSYSVLRYARVGRACKEVRERAQKNQRYIFEFLITAEDTCLFASLFEAANHIGATLTSIDSLPVEYASNVQKFFFSFSLPSENALAFRLFVALNHPSYTPLGIYKETK